MGGGESFEIVVKELEKRTHKRKMVGWTGYSGEVWRRSMIMKYVRRVKQH